MTSEERKVAAVITKYALEAFTESDWFTLGQITDKLDCITRHPRLFRSLSFGDDDYEQCVAEVLSHIFREDSSAITDVIDHFDIDLWYQQKDPDKFSRIFGAAKRTAPDFWKEGFFRLFISHLSSNKGRISAMKASLAKWGVCAFIAHEDIEPTREWMNEVEAALHSMDVLVALVEPGFRDSDWCAQEVGFALGRNVDVIPLRAGLDPFGFFGKFQGIQVKGKLPDKVSAEIVHLLLKKPKHRIRILECMSRAFSNLASPNKIESIELLDSWAAASDEQMRSLLETSSLSNHEKSGLKNIIDRVGAFRILATNAKIDVIDDDIPF